jgi:hypothetical protein
VDEALDADGASDSPTISRSPLCWCLSGSRRLSAHDVFGLEFADVARALGRGEAACRQLAARARAHIEDGRPRFSASGEEGVRLAATCFRSRAIGRY